MTATKWLVRKSRDAIGDPSIVDLGAVLFIGWLVWPWSLAAVAFFVAVHAVGLAFDIIRGLVLTVCATPRATAAAIRNVRKRFTPPPPIYIPPPPPPPPTIEEQVAKAQTTLERELRIAAAMPNEDEQDAFAAGANRRFRQRLERLLGQE